MTKSMAASPGTQTNVVGKCITFSFVFLTLFMLTLGFLALVGATPDSNEVVSSDIPSVPQEALTASAQVELPVRIVAGAIGLDAPVVNPAGTDIEILDKALLKGAVRYPTSARLGENGTILLFGHSSYLPFVSNRFYKTFNNIQKLQVGEVISVYSGATEYRYRVTGLEQANAMSDSVSLPQDGKYLKLVTCNTFAKKEDRFIVTAVLEEVVEGILLGS
jgi:LPXTG-site transpeptidase (sortase) family protein